MKSRSARNNNPGNLRFSPFTEKRGAKNDGDGYAVFPTVAKGLAAMEELLMDQTSYQERTIGEAIHRYAPEKDNNVPAKYIYYVCLKTGLDQHRYLKDLDLFEMLTLITAMIRFEKWSTK